MSDICLSTRRQREAKNHLLNKQKAQSQSNTPPKVTLVHGQELMEHYAFLVLSTEKFKCTKQDYRVPPCLDNVHCKTPQKDK